MTRKNWYWDVHLPYAKIQAILQREDDPRFPRLAGLLLARVQDPKQVFGLMAPVAFCRRYRAIEKEILSDAWTRERAAFWKATYLRLRKELQAQGEKIRTPERIPLGAFDRRVIDQVKQCRKKALMSQKELAGLLQCSQQYISGIETGRETPSLAFLKHVAQATNQRIELIVEKSTL